MKRDINIGTIANDGTGTNWRTAWGYTDSNFNEVYGGMTESSTGLSGIVVDKNIHDYWLTPTASDFIVNLTADPSIDEEYRFHYVGTGNGRLDIDPSGNTINGLENFYLNYDNEMVTVKWNGTEWKAF